jgi:glycosyltransferase involved in cell wall biosynthesis
MPCLDEARTLPECVRQAQAALHAHGIVGEVIVADNGSTDGSIGLAEALGARVIHAKRRGYGAALQAGIAEARGEFVVMGDCDGSYDFGHIDRFVAKLREGHDLVMGNRFAGGIERDAMPRLHRYFGNPLLTAIGRGFFGGGARDFYCGLRGFRRDSFAKLRIRSQGMEFALEMVALMTMFGMRVTEVPTTLQPDGRGRKPHLRTWRDGWRSLRLYLLLSPRWLFWYPGLVLMGVGSAVGLPLLLGPVVIGGVSFDVHTLAVCSTMVLVGFHAALFAALAKSAAVRAGLHPPSGRVERLFRLLTLERGLIVGGMLALAGILGMSNALLGWAGDAYGALDPFQTMRIVIPSLLALGIGAELALAACFLGFADYVESARREDSGRRD